MSRVDDEEKDDEDEKDKELLCLMKVCFFYMAAFSFNANRTAGESKLHNFIGLFF